jgi:hypothetical protein
VRPSTFQFYELKVNQKYFSFIQTLFERDSEKGELKRDAEKIRIKGVSLAVIFLNI